MTAGEPKICDRWGGSGQRPPGPVGDVETWIRYYKECRCDLCRWALQDAKGQAATNSVIRP